ncbi:MAG: hypothetical protein ABIG44_13355 [Planctomycetota bacterium]
MGRWTYYSPLWLGTVITIVLQLSYQGITPGSGGGVHWLRVAGIGVGVGLFCQLVMLATQGAFAQVLPVPSGRSLRGGGAVLVGWLLLLGLLLGFAAVLLGMEKMGLVSIVVGALSLGTLLGSAIAYLWKWPVAQRDFAEDKRF